MNVFNSLDKFFNSLNNYLSYNYILIIFLSLFAFTIFVIFITTSFSYEAKLIKSIDMFNSYFIKNPQITAENLLDFNNKMKSRKVPKQLRKQWQQFVLYRDKSASEYMSFELCVSSPIKNSTFKRDVSIMNIIAYILALVSTIMNLYHSSYEATSLVSVLQHTLLCPILILVLNLFFTIVFDIKHNAIVSDLNQNFQYFELNIDKATSTIPEYVDYEVLFDKNEIKRGMPILYIYLQRRADEEKRELERARLKNVEHEKFNFDEAGVAKSLVLERAMQEAENYIAERKKYLQDTQQINSEITQEEMNFREITKEYQREMQVSKETFDNFKSQLNDVSSSIEANYLKKQQQQELDRQRNLERDYDTATDRHNALLKTLQEELDDVNGQITKARTTLERGMMSEFDTYSQKVYADAERVVKERTSASYEKQQQEIAALREQVDNLTKLNNDLMNRSSASGNNDNASGEMSHTTELYNEGLTSSNDYGSSTKQDFEEGASVANGSTTNDYTTATTDYAATQENDSQPALEQQPNNVLNVLNDSAQTETDDLYGGSLPEMPYVNDTYNQNANDLDAENETDEKTNYSTFTNDYDIFKNLYTDANDSDSTGELDQKDLVAENVIEGEGVAQDNAQSSTTQLVESDETKKKRGRPRKPKPEVELPKRRVGRPRKAVDETALNKPKRPRGRPKKQVEVVEEAEQQPVEKRGRTKKQVEVVEKTEKQPVAKRGRPKKTTVLLENKSASANKESKAKEKTNKSAALNKESATKTKTNKSTVANKESKVKEKTEKSAPTNKKSNSKTKTTKTKTPVKKKASSLPTSTQNDKNDIADLDSYLQEIDNQIAEENAKMEASQKELEKNSRIRKRRR